MPKNSKYILRRDVGKSETPVPIAIGIWQVMGKKESIITTAKDAIEIAEKSISNKI